MKLENYVDRVDELIRLGNIALETKYSVDDYDFVDHAKYVTFRSSSLSFLLSLFGDKHPYYREFCSSTSGASPKDVESAIGVLIAVRDEIAGGWITSTKSIISAEIFSDFLEMTSYLLDEGYKDAAAVMIGSILEGHLRQLCSRANIPLQITKPSGDVVPKKADTLNTDLSKQGIYNSLDHKNIVAWLALRNNAAHGKYEEYSLEQVKLMYQGIIDFMARTS